jgi:hypothetical protein
VFLGLLKRTHSHLQGPGEQQIVVVEACEPWCCYMSQAEPIRCGEISVFLSNQLDARV